VPSFVIAERDAPEQVPPDVVSWWRAIDEPRRALIESTRGTPLYVTDDVEPMEGRKDRLLKPGLPR
jgi:hypothetical protein